MISLTPKTWSSRLVSPNGNVDIDTTLKHGRLVWCPEDGKVWNWGGDFDGNSSNQKIWSYDIALDDGLGQGLGWTLEEQVCPVVGTSRMAGADQITAVWDSNRKLFWMLPGYMPLIGAPGQIKLAVALTPNGNETEISVQDDLTLLSPQFPSVGGLGFINDDYTFETVTYNGLDTSVQPHKFLNVQRGQGGTPKGAHAVGEEFCKTGTSPCGPYTTVRPLFPWTAYSYDRVTRQWQIRSKMHGIPSGEGLSNGYYDALNDKIVRITGTSPVKVTTFNLPDLTRTEVTFSGLGLNSVPIGNNDIAWDPDGRVAYIIQPGTNPSSMLMYRPDAGTMTKATGTGVPPRFTIAVDTVGINCFYPKWDRFNKVVLWPFVYSFSSGAEVSPVINPPNTPVSITRLYIYHPTLNTWEEDAMLPGGPPYPRGNSWVFNESENCLIGMGRSIDNCLFVYRYASTAPAFRPIGVSASIR